ncbi:MAG TPA: twin-arginine translocation signal domain-containing protein, partial [Planctomycetaceae bacterium]|nr:twin-arginine translocation signal domain-containing protein [Planctomycetaceae bacterium]
MSSRSSRRTFLKTTAAVSAGASLLNLHRSLAYAVPRESKWA